MKKFNLETVKEFFAQHVEKVVLGVTGLLVLVFLWLGWGEATTDLPNIAPPQLKSKAESAQSKIQSDTWEGEEGEKKIVFPEPDEFVDKAGQALIATKVSDYSMPVPLAPDLYPSTSKRTDPQIYPIEQLEIKAGNGPIAYRGGSSSGGRGEAGLPGLDFGDFGPSGDGAGRTLTEQERSRLQGYRPSGDAKAEGERFTMLTGLIPIRQQWEAYQSAFREAAGYNAGRDKPNFVYVYVQRSEVNGDAEPEWNDSDEALAATLEWTNEGWAKTRKWAGSPQDMVPLSHRHNFRFVSMPPPPLMLRPVRDYMLHSYMRQALEEEIKKAEEAATGEDQPLEPDGSLDPFSGGGRPSYPGGEGGDVPPVGPGPVGPGPQGGEHGGNYPGEGGEGSGSYGLYDRDGAPRVDYIMFRYYDFRVEPGKQYRYRVRLVVEDPNDPRPRQSGAGEGGERPIGPDAGPETSVGWRPSPSVLSDEVRSRIAARKANSNLRDHFRESPWSEPSPAVEIPTDETVLAGAAIAAKTTYVRGESRRYERIGSEPTAKVAAIIFDKKQGLDIAGEKELGRSSPVRFTKTVEALDPVSVRFEEQEEYPFKTAYGLLDVVGGDDLPGSTSLEKIPRLGEVLLLDPDGKLVVRSEIEDYDAYRQFIPPEKIIEEKPEPDEGDNPLGPYEGGDFGDLGLPGGGERRGGRRSPRRGS